MPPTLLFTHLGRSIPPWTETALRQARRYNACPVILLGNAAALAGFKIDPGLNIVLQPVESLGLSPHHARFRDTSPQSRDFRDGFWFHTTERFFVIEAAMAKLGLRDVFHAENDVMLYWDVMTHLAVFQKHYPGLAVPFDAPERAIASVIYVPDADAIGAFNRFAADAVAPDMNDMELLVRFRQMAGKIDSLPIVPPWATLKQDCAPRDREQFSRHFADFNSIFDAAALGQFLGGIDTRNAPGDTRGFVNETCVFDPSQFKFGVISDAEGRPRPALITDRGPVAINNLHIHSKALANFAW